MRALIAFDKFKDALSAADACAVAAAALPPSYEIDSCPLTDGGEGFAEILTRAAGGRFVEQEVTGPRGATTRARMGIVPITDIPAAARAILGLDRENGEKIAIIEMAQASGLALLREAQRDPWQTSSVGTGELMRAAVEAGVAAILLGVGGSATHDIGAGALAAVGIRAVDQHNRIVEPPIPARWGSIAAFQGHLPAGFPPVLIACDVSNPLLGPQGAAAVYAPQKGLKPDDYFLLEGATDRLSEMLCRALAKPLSLRETPGTGAAGGITFGLMCAANARLLPGFDLVSAWFDLDARIADADVVLTGEGRFDDSSLQGKGPGTVVRRALAHGKRAHVFAGRIAVNEPPPDLALHEISPAALPLREALAATARNLTATINRSFINS